MKSYKEMMTKDDREFCNVAKEVIGYPAWKHIWSAAMSEFHSRSNQTKGKKAANLFILRELTNRKVNWREYLKEKQDRRNIRNR